MHGAPLRIEKHENQKDLGSGDGQVGTGGTAKWAEAVTKLIPGEVIAAYLSGKSVMQSSTPPLGTIWWIGWTTFCVLVVIGLRGWMTSDTDSAVPAEKSAVTVSALSFLVWVYSFGDVFEMLGWWNKPGAALVMIGWTLASPLVLVLFRKLYRE